MLMKVELIQFNDSLILLRRGEQRMNKHILLFRHLQEVVDRGSEALLNSSGSGDRVCLKRLTLKRHDGNFTACWGHAALKYVSSR